MTERTPRVSETEEILQNLYAQLLRTTDLTEREQIQNKIKALRESPEGQQDQRKHNEWVRES